MQQEPRSSSLLRQPSCQVGSTRGVPSLATQPKKNKEHLPHESWSPTNNRAVNSTLPCRRSLHTDYQVLNRPLQLALLQVFDPRAAQRKQFSNLEPSSGLEVIMMVSVALDGPHRNSIVPCGRRPVDNVPLLDKSSHFSRTTRKPTTTKDVGHASTSKKHFRRWRHDHSVYWECEPPHNQQSPHEGRERQRRS